jgi:hypothetical protein
MMTAFCIVAAVAFLFIAYIWSSKDFLNVLIKMLFTGMFVWAVVCALVRFGFHS